MIDVKRTRGGQILPALPRKIAKAVAHMRAMTTPYFDSRTVDEAEQMLRVAIKEALDVNAEKASAP